MRMTKSMARCYANCIASSARIAGIYEMSVALDSNKLTTKKLADANKDVERIVAEFLHAFEER